MYSTAGASALEHIHTITGDEDISRETRSANLSRKLNFAYQQLPVTYLFVYISHVDSNFNMGVFYTRAKLNFGFIFN